MLTQADLRAAVSYDRETGIFTSLAKKRGKLSAGWRAGYRTPKGYTMLQVNGEQHMAHRLAWLYVHGVWPAVIIDHINGDRSDNRIANLREATLSQNQANSGPSKNNACGLKGVSQRKGKDTWIAELMVNGRRIRKGGFKTKEEAHAAYARVAVEHFGEFARTV